MAPPGDGRIVELGLHCVVDDDLGNDVVVEIHGASGPGSIGSGSAVVTPLAVLAVRRARRPG